MQIQKDELLDLIKRYKSDDQKTHSNAKTQIAKLLRNVPDNLIDVIKQLMRQDAYREISLGNGLIAFNDYAWKAIMQLANETDDHNIGWGIAWAIKDFTQVRSVDDYLLALKHKNIHVRWSAALNISAFNDPIAIKPLIDMFYEPDGARPPATPTNAYPEDYHDKVRHCAALSLRKLRHFALHDILEKANDPNANVRESVANALIEITNPEAVEVLSKFLNDPAVGVRRRALEALESLVETQLDNEELLDSLLQQLYHQEQWIQVYATKPLAKFGIRGIFPLLKIATDQELDSDNRFTRYYALVSITKILWDKPDIKSIYHQLIESLKHLINQTSEPNNSLVRREAANILGEINDDISISLLLDAIDDDDPYVLQVIVEKVSGRKSDQILSALKKLYQKWKDVSDSEDAEDMPIEDLKWAIESAIKELSD